MQTLPSCYSLVLITPMFSVESATWQCRQSLETVDGPLASSCLGLPYPSSVTSCFAFSFLMKRSGLETCSWRGHYMCFKMFCSGVGLCLCLFVCWCVAISGHPREHFNCILPPYFLWRQVLSLNIYLYMFVYYLTTCPWDTERRQKQGFKQLITWLMRSKTRSLNTWGSQKTKP